MDLGQLEYDVVANTGDLDRAEQRMDEFADSAKRGERNVEQMGSATRKAGRASEQGMRRVERSTKRATDQMQRLQRIVQLVAGSLVAREIIRYTDAWNNAANQLRQVTDTSAELAGVQKDLMAVANDTRSAFGSTANLYSRLARSTTEMGLSGQELIGITRTINQSFAVSGATAEEASAAITQLSQGLAAGALRGDEFNSVAEQAPGIMRAIARSLDMTIGNLREFAAEGGITAEIVVTALQEASETIDNQFGKSVATFGQQMEVARNNLMEWVGTSEEVNGAVSALGQSIVTLTGHLDTIVSISKVLATLYAGRLAQAMYAAAAAKLAANGAAITLTGSLRALRTVSMSMFGPVGIIAAGVVALGELANALDDSAEKAEKMEFRANELASSLQAMGETSIRTQLASVTLELAKMDGAQKALEEQSRRSSRTNSVLGADFQNLHETIQTTVEAARHGREEHEKMRTQQMALERALELVTESGESASRAIREYGGETGSASEEAKKAAQETDKLADAYRTLRNRIRPVEAAQKRYMADKLTLISYAIRENMAADELSGLLRDLDMDYRNAGDAAEVYGLTGIKAAEDVQTAWDDIAESTIQRLDSTFQDLWSGLIDGSRNAMDSVKRFFSQMLSELAHMAITRPIVVSMAGALGAGGAGAAQAGGIGNISSLGQSALSIGGDTFANIAGSIKGAWEIGTTQGIGEGLKAFGSSSAGGMLATGVGGIAGGFLSSKVFGSSQESNIGSAIGTIAGSFIPGIGNLIGGAVGSFLGGALGSVFGGEKFSGEDPTGLLATRNEFGAAGRPGFERDAFATGALGDIGFAPESRDIDTLFGERDNFENAKQFAEQLAQADNMIAQLARSEEELSAMRRAAADQGLTDMAALESRYTAIFDSLDGDFGEFVSGIEGSIEEIVQRGVLASQAFTAITGAMERLNLQFNAAGAAAYDAAAGIAELAGGVQNISALQSSYYQNFFSDAERAANLQQDLNRALSEMGMELPDNRDGFRALVEAQDLNTKAGRENYVQLLQLAGGFDQLQQSMGGVEDKLAPVRSAWEELQKAVNAEREILREAHKATTESIRDNMRTVQQSMRQTERTARSLRSTLDRMLGQSAVDAEVRRGAAQSTLSGILSSGGLGDQDELERALSVVSEPSEGLFSSFEDYQRDFFTTAHVIDQLEERAGSQLSTQQRTLMALEGQMSQAERQFNEEMARLDETLETQRQILEAQFGTQDWLSTLNGSIQSIAAALGGLTAAREQAPGGGGSGATDAITQAYRDILGRDPDPGGLAYFSGDLSAGQSIADVRESLRRSEEFRTGVVPQFANGGNHSGGWRMVGERGPEIEYTGPSRIHSNNDLSDMNAELTEEVKALRQELRDSQRAVAKNTSDTRKVLERWDNTGIPEDRGTLV